ncbi:MAG: hypothetical protein AAGJ81_06615 [Verrucomicrobiota bacterium]
MKLFFNSFVNVSLLFFFSTLVFSGLSRFFLPFDLVTTRVHIIFGFGMLVFVGLHLMGRGKYFAGLMKNRGRKKKPSRNPVLLLAAVLLFWGFWLVGSIYDWEPVKTIVDRSYESRHQREIFRSNARTAFEPLQNGVQVKRLTDEDASIRLELEWGPEFPEGGGSGQPLDGRYPQIAIWAEAEDGTVLETFFVSQSAAFANEFEWGGETFTREEVLPIWYSRYKDILGKEPLAEDVDGVSSATPIQDFSMETYLKYQGMPFSVFVEVNAPDDPNQIFHHEQSESGDYFNREGIGQPSIVYEAYVFPDDDQRWFLMTAAGHSSTSNNTTGEINYDLSDMTTAKQIVEKILMQVDLPKPQNEEEEEFSRYESGPL